MKKKILYTIALSLMLLGLCQKSIKYLVGKQLGLTEVFVASHKINPRSKISEEDITSIYVPKSFISENVLMSKEDIVGKYSLVDHYIFKESLFYKDSLEDVSNMQDYPLFKLEDGQVLYELKVADIECPRFNIGINQHADIYLTLKDNKDVISDLLISNVEIIAAYDSQGIKIGDKESANIYSVVLAIDEKLINTLNVAKNKGEISLYLKADAYSYGKESILNNRSAVLNYLNLIK